MGLNNLKGSLLNAYVRVFPSKLKAPMSLTDDEHSHDWVTSSSDFTPVLQDTNNSDKEVKRPYHSGRHLGSGPVIGSDNC